MRKVLVAIFLFALATPAAQAQNPPWAQKIFLGVTSHDFGTCPHGAQLKHRLVMKNIYAVPLQITNIRASCGCLTYKASTTTLQPKEEGFIDLFMDGNRFSGNKTVSLFITVGPQFISTAVITVTANARTDVVFNPGEVNFGVVGGGSNVMKTMDVEYAGALDWRLLEVVKSKTAPFTVNAKELYRQGKGIFKSAKAGYQLQVTLNPNAPSGFFREELLLKTNDPNSPTLTVFVEGNVQAALTVSPEQVKLNTIKVGQKFSQKVAVRGQQPFRILSAEGLGNGITAELPKVQAPIHVINIECQPMNPGEFNRKVILQTDVGKGEAITIQVIGTVTP